VMMARIGPFHLETTQCVIFAETLAGGPEGKG
jgi:hypothetical protein